jgi:hypothetical protein
VRQSDKKVVYFPSNLVENLFVIGDITKGEHFFVSGIDHLLDRVQVISNKIVERLS